LPYVCVDLLRLHCLLEFRFYLAFHVCTSRP
jgi:hypothetical protein